MTSTLPYPGPAIGPNAPTVVMLLAGLPTQLPILDPTGVTIVNDISAVVTLGTDEALVNNPISVPVGAVIPWPTPTTLWASSPVGGNLFIIPGLFNYFNPNVIPAPAVAEQVFSGDVTSGQVEFLTLPAGTNSVIVSANDLTVPTNRPSLRITGNTTGYLYYGNVGGANPAYLFSNNTSYFIVPVVSTADPIVTATISTAPGDLINFKVFGSPLLLHEFDFYNEASGLQVAEATESTINTNITIVAGPARLLTVQLTSLTAGLAGSINLGTPANAILRLGATDTKAELALPPNTVLAPGQNLTLTLGGTAGTVGGRCMYVYP